MSAADCPACGESELLHGEPVDGDIQITCGRCAAQWMRGEPRCKCCGRGGGTTVRQLMTTHPRGTLLSVIGARKVPLCAVCDGEVLAAALERNQPVPEDYLSRFLFGEVQQRAVAEPRAASRERPAPKQQARSTRRPVPRPVEPSAREAAPRIPADPTVRQATESFLNDVGNPADGLTMVLLGTEWGASTRLSRLDGEEAAAELGAWVQRTFASRPEHRSQAVATVRRAVEHWQARGWLVHDLAAHLE